ncbi:YnfA family protein [Campylobacter sp. CCUG 57310]|uniref:YnfA family protein n=1 Tax=Campylobacter sp. CCUG 57310 TaxID=2517362 RepID=UPI001C2094CE|nr:YnfA family protein [Campylobacter sp. CCUG 57310]QKF91605.1 UPF0060 domain-containing membrane protein [Campylobacter sp. CCUG 57310]
MITNIYLFLAASFFEIFGCFSFWLYFRLAKSPVWLGAGLISLILFAYILTKIDLEAAGRIYAIYGGIYILSSFLWMVFVEKEMMNRFDIIGLAFVILGVGIIYFGNKLA